MQAQALLRQDKKLKDQMNHKIGAIYHILFKSQYGIWTVNPYKGHVVLKVNSEIPTMHICNAGKRELAPSRSLFPLGSKCTTKAFTYTYIYICTFRAKLSTHSILAALGFRYDSLSA